MELFELFGTLALKGVDEFNQEVDSAANKGSTLGTKLANGMKTVAKVGGAAITAAATGIAVLTKSSVANYAEYEQLVGGVETMFKDSSGTVMAYANDAYKTAGLSANDYMETVTSFSASLLQGLGGDTATAANVANQAITDMSDNANKMGTDMSSIQAAYQGFAKQNYTLLDNLKIGYGGTASEMARLINDSGVLGNSMKVTADTVNQVSFDKIIEAIHVVQTNMGITGTTAAEAASTISGSVAMTKAAWENLTVGIADDTQDMSVLVSNFVDSASTAAGNLLPRIETVLTGIGQLATQMSPVFAGAVTSLVGNVLPQLVTAGAEMVSSLLTGFQSNAWSLSSGVTTAFVTIITAIAGLIPQFITTGTELITALMFSIAAAIPGVASSVSSTIPQIITALSSGIPMIIDAGTTLFLSLVNAIPTVVNSLASAVPGIVSAIATTLTSGVPALISAASAMLMAIVDAIPTVVDALTGSLPTLIDAIVTTLTTAIPQLLDAAVQLFMALIDALPQVIEALTGALPSIINAITTVLVSSVPQVISAAITLLMAVVDALPTVISALTTSLPEIITSIVNVLIQGLPAVLDAAITLLMALIDAIPQIVIALTDALPEIITSIVTALIDNYPAILDAGITLFLALVEAIPEIIINLSQALDEMVQSGIDTMLSWCSNFGDIASDWIKSLLDGLKNAWKKITDWLSDAWDGIKSIFSGGIDVGVKTSASKSGGAGMETVNGSHASGLDYVPYDGYIAELHKGEMVVPANESKYIRSGALADQNGVIVELLSQILASVKNVDMSDMSININKREFGRLVKAVN